MLDALLKLIEYLTKFLEAGAAYDQRFFDRIATPTYEVAERVVLDYLKLFQQIRDMAAADVNAEDVARAVEKGRIEYLPARMRLRALLERDHLWRGVEGDLFVKGVRGILTGGLSIHEDRQIDFSYDYARTTHTLLDLLYRLRFSRPTGSLPVAILELVGIQETAVQRAWQDVVVAYSAMQERIATRDRLG